LKSYAEILKNAQDIGNILKDHRRYWAHTHPLKKEELLEEHVSLVNKYSEQLVEAHGLDSVINSLITEHVSGWDDPDQCAIFLKECFAGVIVFHDFGKINENFQIHRMKNRKDFTENGTNLLTPSHGHSKLGAFLFISHFVDYIYKLPIAERSKAQLAVHCYLLSYSIMQHHSGKLFSITENANYLSAFKQLFEALRSYITEFSWSIDEARVKNILEIMEVAWAKSYREKRDYKPFPFFTLIKLNFSLLTASDYLATHHYNCSSEAGKEGEISDFGVFISYERVNEITNHLRSFRHNKKAFQNPENHQFIHPLVRSNINLNILREEMAVEVIQTIRKNIHERLFYLEAPTGGGKTNLSAIIATELLTANPELNKIYYVFPFTTLITQTFEALKTSTGLRDDEIAELHSKSGLASKQDLAKEEDKDGLYFSKESGGKKDYIDNLFALFPVTLMSHVKFFDILKSNKKEINYQLHRLANSVVIIDELQSYNPKLWDKMLFFITQYAKHFNIRFVIMSATLPKISGLKTGLEDIPEFIELLPLATRYLTNPNFKDRVRFNFNLFNKGKIKIDYLANEVIEKSKEYLKANKSVKTIVEFIFKKSASDFFAHVQHSGLFHKILLLSGTVLETRRKEIINYIKRNVDGENILLITTQVVEAGVDIDMDLGFKNVSLIDSDEQLAGRVNRNANKDNCEVYLFKMDDAGILYGADYRYKKTREEIDSQTYQEILINKDFSKLYDKVIGFIDSSNKPIFKGSIQDYTDGLFHFCYPLVDEDFKIIEQESASVFVPLDLPIVIDAAVPVVKERIFSLKEMDFLINFGILPTSANRISGEGIWDLYLELIEGNKFKKENAGFNITKKIEFKLLQSIMSKFSFSLMQFGNDYKELKRFGEEKYGYLYLSLWNEIRDEGSPYNYESGLNNAVFKTSNFI